jgi:hypothetical protein
VFIFVSIYFVIDSQSGNFWIHPRIKSSQSHFTHTATAQAFEVFMLPAEETAHTFRRPSARFETLKGMSAS